MNSKQANATLLSIGDELLLGEIVDTNKPYIAQALLPLGIKVAAMETTGDELHEIVAAFGRALDRAQIVIATGGLGPTDDDLTLEALGIALHVELEYRQEVMDQMAARLNRPAASFSSSNRKQAMLPKGSNILRNNWGTAPGVHFPTRDGKHIFLMPGVPREMKGILREHIVPWLASNFSSGQKIVIKKLHVFGIPESTLGERIKPLMQAGHNPDVGTRVGGGVVTVRLVARAPSEAEAQALMAPALQKVREALSEGIFGEDEDTLSHAALGALLTHKKSVAIAESCTAGLVSAMLTDIPGASGALLEGAVVYSNEAKIRTCGVKAETLARHGAVSAQCAEELAQGIRVRAGADIGLSVTGIAGPGGGSESKPVGLVYFGIATEKSVTAIEKNYSGLDRASLRERAGMQALDLLRRAAKNE